MKFSVVVEKDEDGYYVALVPELPVCHTQARTLDTVDLLRSYHFFVVADAAD
jgi:predicted RNase H-like HicB family nuclease